MSKTVENRLERFPEGAIEVARGTIQGLNRAARRLLPQLAVGQAPPAALMPPLEEPESAGTFSYEGVLYLFSRVTSPDRALLLFRPAPQSTLSDRQLSGFVRQMRDFLQDILLDFHTQDPFDRRTGSFGRNFCRIYRLLTNLDFLRAAGSPEGVPFRPVTLDLAGFTRALADEAGDLLEQGGVRLSFRCQPASLLTAADPRLLEKLLLTLLSNGAKAAAPGGEIFLTLASRRGRALFTLSDSGEPLPEEKLEELLPGLDPGEEGLPAPWEGAGMGLSIARHIVALHGGTMLLEHRPQAGLFSVVSLPIRRPEGSLTVRSPAPEEAAGFSPALLELSDVLPPSLFPMDDDL